MVEEAVVAAQGVSRIRFEAEGREGGQTCSSCDTPSGVRYRRPAGGRTEFTEKDEDNILRWLVYHHPQKTNWKSIAIYKELVRAPPPPSSSRIYI